jgi:hypothetical protein
MTTENQTTGQQVNGQVNASPIVTVDSVDGSIQISLRQGVHEWQAIGLLEVALDLLRSKYQRTE